ncbi:Class V chitinase [Bienertia sinuspersici]
MAYYSIFSFIALLSLFHFQLSNAVKGGYYIPDSGVSVSEIDSTLFTHLFCAFANLDPQTNQLSVPAGCSSFSQTVKQKNPSVKAIISIGGGTDKPTQDLKTMANNPNSRKTFIESSINMALSNNFDGLDLDWEQQSTAEEMTDLGALLTEWRAALQAKKSSLILTAAVRYTATVGGGIPFPAKAMSDSLDFVNLMAYDFYGPTWNPAPQLARPNAALRGQDVSGESGVDAWINAGVPANKLVLGLPFYGYAWKLVNGDDNGVLAPVSGVDTSVGDSEGSVTYKQIKQFISQKRATVKYDSNYVTNYCYSGSTWIGFDGLETVKQKVLYAKNKASLLGYFAWNIVQDNNWALSKQASQTWGS